MTRVLYIRWKQWVESFGHCKGDKLAVAVGWGSTHHGRADKYRYPHDRRADKDSYSHDSNVTDDLCSLIKLCFAFIMFFFY